MYAIVRTGGKQYRVERGQTLLVERLPVAEGESCSLEPLLYVDGETVIDRGQPGPEVRVEARVLAHERGPKLRVVKFKPKRGYKRRTGHRQELTRLEITAVEAGESRSRKRSSGAAAKEQATGAPPKEQATGAAPKEQATGAPPKEQATGAPPKEQATGAPPKEQSDGT